MSPEVLLTLVFFTSNLRAILCQVDRFTQFRIKSTLWVSKTKEVVSGLSFFQCMAACDREISCKVVKYEPDTCTMAKTIIPLQPLVLPVDTYGLPTENVLIKRSIYQTG